MIENSPIKERSKKYVGTYLIVIFFIVAFGFGMAIDRMLYVKKQMATANGNAPMETVINVDRSINKSNLDFDQFWQVWDKIKTKYVSSTADETAMLYGAIQGLVGSLGDPYSLYFTPTAADEFAKDLTGELEGIGAEIGIKEEQLMVISPLPDSPAEKAGLKPGDKILTIDTESTAGMDVNTAVSKIRGKAKTQVTLAILRAGNSKPQDIVVTRAKIIVPSVLFSMKPNDIAYIRVMQFNEDTKKQFGKYVKELKSKQAKGIILDLRNNPGGYLDTAIDMGSYWVTDGPIVSEKGRNGISNEHKTSGSHPLNGIKTIVLVNKGSASASEIVAGALQDTKNAILLGEQTFGKGSVQDLEPFPDGSALKLTIAEWYTPNEKNINKEGIKPNIEIKEDWEKEKVGDDVVLQSALDIFASSTFKW